MCTGPEGRLLVCDHGNDRVLALHLMNDLVKYETVITIDKIDGDTNDDKHPFSLYADSLTGKLYVGFLSGKIQCFAPEL